VGEGGEMTQTFYAHMNKKKESDGNLVSKTVIRNN
jgi:hypothetical protein